MIDKHDRELTEEEFVASHTSHMGNSPEVVTYLRLRHQYILRNATWAAVAAAYQTININLRKQWRPTQHITR